MILQVARGGNDFCSSMFQLKAPIIVVGCIVQSFHEIETCIECSALRQIQVKNTTLLFSV
jgi:hypothetical protein